jgi:hypothetical protein
MSRRPRNSLLITEDPGRAETVHARPDAGLPNGNATDNGATSVSAQYPLARWVSPRGRARKVEQFPRRRAVPTSTAATHEGQASARGWGVERRRRYASAAFGPRLRFLVTVSGDVSGSEKAPGDRRMLLPTGGRTSPYKALGGHAACSSSRILPGAHTDVRTGGSGLLGLAHRTSQRHEARPPASSDSWSDASTRSPSGVPRARRDLTADRPRALEANRRVAG